MTILLPRDRRYSRYLFDYSARFAIERNAEQAISGQAATWSRASIGTMIGSDGRVHVAAHSQPRYQWFDLDGDGVRETPCRLLEDARTNLCLQSENFGTTWSATGTPTRSAAAHTKSGVILDLLGDDTGGAVEFYQESITFTGNAQKAVSVFVKKGTSAPASGSLIEIIDTTAAGAARLLATVSFSGAVPVVVMTTGTYLGYEVLFDGVYRLLFTTTTVTATNANSIVVAPAGTSAEQGNIYIGGVQVEDAVCPSSYIKTTTATVTRAADSLTFPFNVPPQALTLYVKGVVLATDFANNPYWADIGLADGSEPHFFLYTSGAQGSVAAQYKFGGANTGVATVGHTRGDTLEALGTLAADGTATASGAKNGGSAATPASSAASSAPLPSAWSDTTLRLNGADSGKGFFAFQSVRIAAGVQSLTYMRNG